MYLGGTLFSNKPVCVVWLVPKTVLVSFVILDSLGGSIWGILPFKKHHMALRNSAPYTRKNSFRDPSEWRLKEKPLGHYNFFAPRNPAIRAHFNGPASMDPSRPLKFQGCEWVYWIRVEESNWCSYLSWSQQHRFSFNRSEQLCTCLLATKNCRWLETNETLRWILKRS